MRHEWVETVRSACCSCRAHWLKGPWRKERPRSLDRRVRTYWSEFPGSRLKIKDIYGRKVSQGNEPSLWFEAPPHCLSNQISPPEVEHNLVWVYWSCEDLPELSLFWIEIMVTGGRSQDVQCLGDSKTHLFFKSDGTGGFEEDAREGWVSPLTWHFFTTMMTIGDLTRCKLHAVNQSGKKQLTD